MSAGNGNSMVPNVPEDIVWDENNVPTLFNCTNHTFHTQGCDGTCGELEHVTEIHVKLINEGLAFARAGMNWHGVPRAYLGMIPVSGIGVELYDLLIWVQVLRDKFLELTGQSLEEFDEDFTRLKYERLHELRMENEEAIRKQRVADQFGVVENKLLGPDGRPL